MRHEGFLVLEREIFERKFFFGKKAIKRGTRQDFLDKTPPRLMLKMLQTLPICKFTA
jgi:hypothetical protein